MSAYDRDLHAWAQTQADALRRRSANEVDWDNVAEEIESLGKQERAEFVNRLNIILLHLLKWAYQPDLRGSSWSRSIRIQRKDLARHLRDSPSLKAGYAEALADAYDTARIAAADETGLEEPLFPQASPFTLEQALDDAFWPQAITRPVDGAE